MSQITFDQAFNQAYAECDYKAKTITALAILWEQGVETFEKLYGAQAHHVIKLCYDVSPRFCLHVVCVVYGLHWSWEKPDDFDKALMTNMSLLLDNSLNQFKVLMHTFLQSAKQKQKDGAAILFAAIDYLYQQRWIDSDLKTQAENLIASQSDTPKPAKLIALTDRGLDIIKLSAISTLKLNATDIPLTNSFTKPEQQALIFHANTYVGCPRVWDATMQINTMQKK